KEISIKDAAAVAELPPEQQKEITAIPDKKERREAIEDYHRPHPSLDVEDAESTAAPGVFVEWVAPKNYYRFWRDQEKFAYADPHGDGGRWRLLDAGYQIIDLSFASTGPEAIERVAAMVLDGSWDRAAEQRSAAEQRRAQANAAAM